MAAQFKNIIVNVVDNSGDALANAAVTLLGGANPQVLQTGATGQCTFSAMPPGDYKLMTVHEGFNARVTSLTHTNTADSSVTITMKVVDEDSVARDRSIFFTVLTGLQYLFLALLAALFAMLLYKGITAPGLDLSKTDSARGMITFVVSVVTVAIALILVVGAAFMSGSKDLDKRLTFGKEVFTVLVGVLGTVMGFYYGQAAATGGQNPAAQAGQTTPQAGQTIQVTAPQLTPPAPKVGTQLTMTGTISGGEKPYTFTVTFSNPAAITDNSPGTSADGNITRKFTVANIPTLAGVPITYKIEVKDSKGATGLFDKGTFTPTQ